MEIPQDVVNEKEYYLWWKKSEKRYFGIHFMAKISKDINMMSDWRHWNRGNENSDNLMICNVMHGTETNSCDLDVYSRQIDIFIVSKKFQSMCYF